MRQRQQRGARFGEGEAARCAVEQLEAGAFLQALQLQAHRRLGQVQQRRRARNRAFARHGDETAQGLGARKVGHLGNLS